MIALYCFVILIMFSELSDCELIRHTFVIEYFSGSPDGVFKEKILGINGQFPGPLIEAHIGDTLQVDVINRIQDGQNTSIHWHGIHQKETPFDDGTAQFTQCPLAYLQTQRYSFKLKQAGTFWYHSHVRNQLTEGLWGVLIVHNKPEQYSYDGSIIITLSDWYHHTAYENDQWHLQPSRTIFPHPDSGLINGAGRYECGFAIHPCNISYQVRPVFKVQRDKTYRVHVINTGTLLAYNFSIDAHTLQVIETDSIDVKKGMYCEIASIAAGQRYSFLITTKEKTANRFLIRAKMRRELLMMWLINRDNNNMYTEKVIEDVTAVLEYSNKDSVESEPFSYLDQVPQMDRELIPIDEMELEPWDGVYAPIKYDKEVVLTVDFFVYKDGVERAAFNTTPFLLPDSVKPLLMSVADGENINDAFLHIEVDYMHVVQIVINNPLYGPHPFHLHGYDFWVLGKGAWNDGNFEARRHNQTLKLTGPKRDTVVVEEMSWAVIRFIADNPGRKEIENMKVTEEAHRVCEQNMYSIDNKSDKNVDISLKPPIGLISSSSSSVKCVKMGAGTVFLFLVISVLNNLK